MNPTVNYGVFILPLSEKLENTIAPKGPLCSQLPRNVHIYVHDINIIK